MTRGRTAVREQQERGRCGGAGFADELRAALTIARGGRVIHCGFGSPISDWLSEYSEALCKADIGADGILERMLDSFGGPGRIGPIRRAIEKLSETGEVRKALASAGTGPAAKKSGPSARASRAGRESETT